MADFDRPSVFLLFLFLFIENAKEYMHRHSGSTEHYQYIYDYRAPAGGPTPGLRTLANELQRTRAMPKKGGRRKQLLHGDWLEPQLERVLLEVFGRFDADGDGALNKAELQAFAAACNDGETLPDDELEQIADYFEITEDGALTKGGFFQMMFMQTTSRPQDTWNDLKALGYDESLTLHNNQGHLSGSVVAVVANPATPETDVPDKPDDPDVPGRSPAPDTDEAQEELAAAAT